ncbi:hypothetical protein P879_08412 [Paragonimus westermani]|uniref:DH domain-containing protein n=1 Tax=Paragonimus westermani TaxID=34504 RepID=A0A8T0CY56_9TREM|nr:hypothetical protein P879_08412 [Paragonimus westermani]
MKNVHKPMECVDSITERVLSWNTRAKDLNRRGVNIREIGSLVTKANTPVTTSTKKLEKRGSASGDNLASLQQWFSYFASADRESKTLADRYEISCLKELPPSSTPSPRGSWNRRKGSMEPKTTSGTESEYIFQTVPDSPRLTRSTSQLDDANSLARLIDYRRRLLTIGDNWEDIVKPDRELTTQEKKKQAAIWEVFVTEINYLNYIRNILNVYMDQFNKIHDNLFLNLEPAQMFNNLVQVYQSNLRLWFGYLHKAYTRVRDSGDLMKADILEPGFMQIPQLFWPYISYCLELPRCQKYIKHANNTNTTFSTFLRWADSNGLEHREPLWDQLAKPFKRVTQYCLMLENIRKYCESQEEINSVSRMVAHISAFVRLIDNQINHLEPREEMDALVDELMFPDYNENPGDEYQYFYDHFRRSSLLEDIELPAPVVLTMPEVRPILDSFVLDQDSWVTSNETSGPPISGLVSPPPVSESTTLGNSINSQQKFDRGGATRESNQSMFDPHITASRSNSLKQDITTPLIDIQPDSIQVYLCKWSPPKSYNISKLSPNVLDRIRTANMPVGLRRTVPRRLLHKGTLRFRERQGKWTDVTCFILTDQFLITKSYKRENADRYKVYKTPVRLDKLVINKMSESKCTFFV